MYTYSSHKNVEAGFFLAVAGMRCAGGLYLGGIISDNVAPGPVVALSFIDEGFQNRTAKVQFVQMSGQHTVTAATRNHMPLCETVISLVILRITYQIFVFAALLVWFVRVVLPSRVLQYGGCPPPPGIHPYVPPGFHRAGTECRLRFSRFVCSLVEPFLHVFNQTGLRHIWPRPTVQTASY